MDITEQRLQPVSGKAVAAALVAATLPARSKQLRDLVAGQIRQLVAGAGSPAYQRLLLDALRRPGHLLSSNPDRAGWPLFPLVTHEALTGQALPALPAAVSIELFAAAADLFDDLEDGDLSGHLAQYPTSSLINAASGLLMLAQSALLEAPTELIPAGRWHAAARILARAAVVATNGQAADLEAEVASTISVEHCVALARDKAGALVAAACQMGAVLATDDPALVSLVGEFGNCLGITQQVLNDLRDLCPESDSDWKSDLARRKKTLPVAYALHVLDSDQGGSTSAIPETVASFWRDAGSSTTRDEEEVVRAWLLSIGALHFAGLMADVYRRRAIESLEQMRDRVGQAGVERIAGLLPVAG